MAAAAAVFGPSPLASVIAVAPNPTTGIAAARIRIVATAVSSGDAVGLGHRHRPALGAVEAIHVEGDVDAVDARGDRACPALDGGQAGLRAEHPGPELRDPRRREHPRFGLVEDLPAEQSRVLFHRRSGRRQAATRSGSPRPQSIANGIPQTLPDGVVSGVLKSPCASNQAIA